MIVSVLMAGGFGTRMKTNEEKPLVLFKNRTLIDHVISNLNESKYIEEIFIATSDNSPNVSTHAKKINEFGTDKRITNLNTPGNGYLNDLSFILEYFQKKSEDIILVFINSDLPLVGSEIIDYVIEEYLKNDKPAMSVLVPIEIYEKNGIEPSMSFNDLVPSGLNILKSINEIQEEKNIIIPDIRLALNINTVEDLKVLNRLFK